MPESLRYVKICGRFTIPQEHNNIKELQDIQKICLHFPGSKFKAAMCSFSQLRSIYAQFAPNLASQETYYCRTQAYVHLLIREIDKLWS